MKRITLGGVLIALLLTVLALPAPTAEAAPKPTATIDIARWVDVSDDGTYADWTVRIKCPKGKQYTLTALVADLGTDAPHDDGGDRGVRARVETTGTCTGGTQTLKLRLTVQSEDWVDPVTGETVMIFWPMSEDGGPANTAVGLSGDGFGAVHCQHQACASTSQNWYAQFK